MVLRITLDANIVSNTLEQWQNLNFILFIWDKQQLYIIVFTKFLQIMCLIRITHSIVHKVIAELDKVTDIQYTKKKERKYF